MTWGYDDQEKINGKHLDKTIMKLNFCSFYCLATLTKVILSNPCIELLIRCEGSSPHTTIV